VKEPGGADFYGGEILRLLQPYRSPLFDFIFLNLKKPETENWKPKTENRILKCGGSTKIFMTGPRMG
jgi:hypothetical protein